MQKLAKLKISFWWPPKADRNQNLTRFLNKIKKWYLQSEEEEIGGGIIFRSFISKNEKMLGGEVVPFNL